MIPESNPRLQVAADSALGILPEPEALSMGLSNAYFKSLDFRS
jgi:hypothetical protein